MFPDQERKQSEPFSICHVSTNSVRVAQVRGSSISLSALSLWALGMSTLLRSGFYQLPVTVNWQMLTLKEWMSCSLKIEHKSWHSQQWFVAIVLCPRWVGTFVKVQLLLINFLSDQTSLLVSQICWPPLPVTHHNKSISCAPLHILPYWFIANSYPVSPSCLHYRTMTGSVG